MAEFGFSSQKLQFKEGVIVLEPRKAFQLFVAPRLHDEKWIEDSSKLTDTNMSSREWAGLVAYALSLSQLTGETLLVGKDGRNGDGTIARIRPNGNYDGLFVEQTLLTYRRHNDLLTGIKERIEGKSSKGKNYAGKQDLILWCNINGTVDVDKITAIVESDSNLFGGVAVMGFNKPTNTFVCYIFRKGHGMVRYYTYSYSDLIPYDDTTDQL